MLARLSEDPIITTSTVHVEQATSRKHLSRIYKVVHAASKCDANSILQVVKMGHNRDQLAIR